MAIKLSDNSQAFSLTSPSSRSTSSAIDIGNSSAYSLSRSPIRGRSFQRTHSDLRADPRFQAQAEKFLAWLGENQGAFESVTGGLINNDIFETLRDEEGRLGTAIDRANIMRDAPEDIKESYKYLRQEFEDSKAGSFNEIAKAAFDRGVDMFADPINLAFALVAPGVGGAAASKAAPAVTAQLMKETGRQSASRTLRNIATANAAKAGAFEGAVWTGVENVARQDKDISLGLQDAFSNGDFAVSTVAGGVLGAGAGAVLSRLFNGTPSRAEEFILDNQPTVTQQIRFNDPTHIDAPTEIPYQRVENGELVTKKAKIVYGPLIEADGKPRTRTDGSRVNASRNVDEEGNVTVRIDVNALRASFNKKPWTRDDVTIDGRKITPLKASDIRTEEEWIMFNLFHELDHASFLRPEDMPRATYENGANVAALRELKKWRRFNAPYQDVSTIADPKITNTVDREVDKVFKRAKGSLNSIGQSYYDRIKNPLIDNQLLRTFTSGKINPNTGEREAIVLLPETDAANIIYAIKDIILKDPNAPVGKGQLSEEGISSLRPEIIEAIRKYNFNPEQLDFIVREITDTYVAPTKEVRDGIAREIQNYLSPKEVAKLAKTLSAESGGGTTTADKLIDEINATLASVDPLDTPLDIKNNIRTRILDQLTKYNATSILGLGKSIGILAPGKRYSPNVIGNFQQRLVSESGQNWTGEVKVRDLDDYNTLQSRLFGYYTAPIVNALTPIKGILKRKELKDVYDIIAEAVRTGNKSLEGKTFPTKLSKQMIVDAADTLRAGLNSIGKEAYARDLVQNLETNYFPRLWNREAIEKNKEQFKQLLISSSGVPDLQPNQVDGFVEDLLDIKYQFGNEHQFSGNSFFANRTIDLANENAFKDFLITDLFDITSSYFGAATKAIAKKDRLGVRNIEDFHNIWLTAVEKEMKANNAPDDLILKTKQDMSYLYKNVTGEGLERFGKKTTLAIDSYTLANRMAYLPLATISSLTEIFINMSKAGYGTSYRGFRDTIMNGSQKMYYDSMDVLQKVYGLTREESLLELNSVGTALAQSVADGTERLGGDAFQSKLIRDANNAFFKFNMLEPWTRFVQLTSYTIGKRLIVENIESLANKIDLIDSGNISKAMQTQIDELSSFGVPFREGIDWYRQGAKMGNNPTYKKIIKGANAYTNEVILNPTSQSALKPTYMSNPKTAILGQLLGYPAAFTNTIMKNVAKDIARNPSRALTRHIPTAAIMAGTAAFLNGVRTRGEAFEDKEAYEIAIEGLVRTGANGLFFDQVSRGIDATKYYQDPAAIISGIGVLPGDMYKLIKQGDLVSFFFNKTPGTGARDLILGLYDEDLVTDLDLAVEDYDRRLADMVPKFDPIIRTGKYKGGEVYDVPQVNPEPDERIDRMTGMPYDIQAGEAFVDEEDRDIRGTFNEGGVSTRDVVKTVVLDALKRRLNPPLNRRAEALLNAPINLARGNKQEVVENVGEALGIGPIEQRNNERDAVTAVNKAIDDGIVPEKFRIPTDDYGFVKQGNIINKDLFDAVNHGLLAYRYGTNPLMRKALQIKEGKSFQLFDPNKIPADSLRDAFNNERGFTLRKQGLTEEEAIQTLINDYQTSSAKLSIGLPLSRGEDLLVDEEKYFTGTTTDRNYSTIIGSGSIQRED